MKTLLAALVLGATLVAAPAWAQQVLRLAHNAAPGNPKAEASLKFAELVAQKTKGRVKVEVGGSAQYGDDVEALTNMRLGTLAFSANSQGSTSNVVPQFAVLGLPFLFQDLPQAWQVLDGPVGERLAGHAKEKGLVLLGLWDNGIRHVSNNVRPITKPEDLAGVKLRTPPDPITVDIFKGLGANPIAMQFSELYIALQQGVVDGQENPLMNIHSSKLHEVQKFISMTGHKYESTPLLASAAVFNALSKADQQAVREAAAEAGKLNRELSRKADEELRGKIEAAGVKFNAVDPAPFAAKTKAVYDKWQAQFPELVALVQKEAAAAAKK
jgi:tripartite ATP-independent transporter DctP family solute receptor